MAVRQPDYKELSRKEKTMRVTHTILISLAGALIALITIGTIFAFVRSSTEPIHIIGGGRIEPVPVNTQYDDTRVFSGLGQLRIPLVNSTVLTLFMTFPYPANDIAFTEELAAKIGEFKIITSDYFSSLPEDKITFLDEDAAKAEILRRFNANLRLGHINALYFNDLIILD